MRRVNYNTTALLSALKSDIPSLKKEAKRLVLDAMKTEPTQYKAALKLGMGGDRSMRSCCRVIEGIPDPPPKTKAKKKAKKKTAVRKRKKAA